jgi:hypothetical protein
MSRVKVKIGAPQKKIFGPTIFFQTAGPPYYGPVNDKSQTTLSYLKYINLNSFSYYYQSVLSGDREI